MPINVLVVDSDTTSCDVVGDIVDARYPDVEVTKVYDGEKAIDVLTEHGDYVDAVVLATDLPVTDGWEVLYVIKDPDNWPTIPVVMMITEASMWEDSLKAHTIGANHFVSKPFESKELLGVLDKLLEAEYTE